MRILPLDRRSFVASGLALLAGASASRASTRVRLGVIPVIGAAPVFVALGEGWLREAGLEVTTTTFDSGPNMIQALASGTVDVYVAGVAPLGVARSRGIDVKVVASTATGENVFVAGPRLARFFEPGVSAGEAFRRYRAASGRPARLATQPAGSVPNTTLQFWLWERAQAAREDVDIVPMGIDATQQAVLADAVEGAIVREAALTIIRDRKPDVRLVAGGDDLFPGQPGTVVAVSGAFLRTSEAAVQTIVDGVVRAVTLLRRDAARAVPHVATALGRGIVDPQLVARALGSPASHFVADPRLIIEPSRAMQRYQVRLGALSSELPLDELFDSRFFERSRAGR